MISLKVLDTKKFMNILLKDTLFDAFEVRGVELQTFTKFQINGILDKEFFPLEEQELYTRNFVLWSELKPIVFQLIKGSRPPRRLKAIFSLPSEKTAALSTDASALFLNLLLEQKQMQCTTGTALKTFSLEKHTDQMWDDYILGFFQKSGIFTEKL